MVKFSRELEAQLIPEWKDAFVNYRQLKKHVKKIKFSLLRAPPRSTADSAAGDSSGYSNILRFGFSIIDPCRAISARFSSSACLGLRDLSLPADDESICEMEAIQSRKEEEDEFFARLGEELSKVTSFYKTKESEFCERGEALSKQLQILLDLKQVLHEHHRRRHHRRSTSQNSSVSGCLLSRLSSSSFSGRTSQTDDAFSGDGSPSTVTEEMIAALERNGISFVGSARSKAKKGMKPRAATMRIDIPATTPGKTIIAVTSMIWEDLVNGSRKEGGGDYISLRKLQCAEKMIRGAFVELYRGLGLLKTYSSLNMVAFSKILKKYDKVSKQQESSEFMKRVKRAHFISSDKVVKLADEVESVFIKNFAKNDRKKAMKFLRPHQPKDSHMITFFVGTFVTLFTVYAILAHLSGIFSATSAGYMETVYPVFSMFALLSLHIFLYGCNLFMWKSCRINYNFIFEFNPNSALKYRDAFLICTSFMTMVVGAMVIHLFLKYSNFASHHIDAIPGALLLVLMADFFMADQLTSQIPLLRHIEFTTCYYMAEGFKSHPYEVCTNSKHYKLLAYVISFLPYYCRAMQCVRRYMEEGYDTKHLANAGKYVSAMVAAAVRWKFAVDQTPAWLIIVAVTSTFATLYQLYWDFVMDWGLLNISSKNLFLRDDLILKNKAIYYVSIILNFVLRLAWIETVLRFSLRPIEHRLVDFLLACMEIVRRGHWNFYRLENEHLNNAGKFRAVKAVPLPFREMESEG
ncbi:Phosphate transporter PHO1 [Apostasia shenzhenica]|uniref:Phosphate transporter PHO1 n=1 Tax=Apostasia shenzhenica TaxID=1088818 RepID=A0A2I0AYF7_9ASPA|nr:Phosphate transporter PHO1 [Apostasia shenzhenica]